MSLPPVTNDRIEMALDSMGLHYERQSETVTQFSFDNATIVCATYPENALLHFFGMWHAVIGDDVLPDVTEFVASLNWNHFVPKHGVAISDDHRATVTADYYVFTNTGLSDDQLGMVVESSIRNIMLSFKDCEDRFPQLVHWTLVEEGA
ncbi:Putative bacterial sensory transduction regulator [Corynebacterium mustelae]|uniref:Putative bacterial sensory transduction regulator n=1 Tax=Corynebacterium mustelae TaxID=571915 RepID=A0A0G3GV07_9CORY|nr:YbjN domain-containing protein [Corynebacterium mustelae]AKK05016.1 Putative bacterial sensory transduction regulator [Corynebacterium mustelae]